MSLLAVHLGLAQVSASFTSPSSACLQETISLSNTSQNANSFIWDFCDKDLESIPTANTVAQLPNTGLLFYAGLRMTFENGNWFGLVSSSDRNSFFRLDFGAVITSTPVINDVGNFGAGSPGAMDLIRVNNTLYGFISTSYGGSLTRITWGNGIKQAPTDVTNFGSMGIINGGEGIKAVSSNGENYVFVTNVNTGNIAVIQFGNSFSNVVQNTKLIGGGSGLVGPWGIDLINEGSNWFGLLACRNLNKVFKMSFGSSLFNDPTFSEVGTVNDGTSLKLVQEGNNYVGLVRSRTAGLYQVRFGASMNNMPTIDYLGFLGVLQNESRSLELVKDSPSWHAITVDVTSARVHRLDFFGNCLQNMTLNSSTENNFDQAYKTSGNYSIELTAIDNSGNRSVISAPITVTSIPAAAVSIVPDASRCLGVSNAFLASSTQPITQYDWDFNGQATSNSSNPLHQFAQAGPNNIVLKVTDVNGCHNKSTSTLTIFNPPNPDFNQPLVIGTVCTEQPYEFANTTTFDAGSNPTWQWLVDAVPFANSQNLTHTFHQVKTFDVTLASSIPGCTTFTTKNFALTGAGTAVDFSFSGQCLSDVTQFTNNTVGSIASYLWTFGDGQVSNQISPSHQFATIGNYSVTLQVTNAGGCTNSKEQPVIITTAPVPDFYIDLPPFSCSGTPTQFHDATPAPTDGNVTSWKWTFGVGGATSTQQSPLHTYHQSGTYPVKLEVETNFGCVGTAEQDIFIAETPTADFSFGPACLNQGTQFQSLSMVGVQSWQWTIGNTAYSFSNPTHTFTQPGSYSAMLVVVGQNACEALATKTIVVKAAPQLDFTNSVPCSEQIIAFTDQSTGNDLPQTWNWIIDGGARTGSPTNYTFETAGAKSVQMNVITSGGCQYSITKNLIVAPSPTASFILSNKQGPPPLQVLFTNTSQNATAYTWDFGLSNATSILVSPSFTFNTLGDYLVELTASNSLGCSDTFTETVHVVVPSYNLTLETISVQQSPASSSKSIVASITNNSNLSVLETDVWLTGSSGLRIKANIEINLAAHATGEFTLPLEVFTPEEYLCVELSAINDTNSSDNQRCENLFNTPALISPYPNPTRGPLWFDVVLNEGQTGTLSITDVLGQRVFSQAFSEMKEGLNRIAIDLSGNHAGLYLAVWEVAGHKREFTFLVY